ncbi:MAG: decaprenyl-phosphate phosphoribosyltransferase [Gemmatimonadaceae bacterium]
MTEKSVAIPPATGSPPAILVDRAPVPTDVLGRATELVVLLRPRQWVKNGFVLAPLLFSGRAGDPAAVAHAVGAFVCFCLIASGIYCWNDVADSSADRAHPTKRDRPIAAGRVSPATGIVLGSALVLVSLLLGYFIAPSLSLVLAVYAGLNIIYSLSLKRIVLVDVFAIAAFFILRLLAGVTAISVHASVWLLLCGGLLSLYLGFAKRRHELTLLADGSNAQRTVLLHYDAATLDQISGILLSVTIVSYIMYTISSRTAVAVGSEALSYSTIFVLYGCFRYLILTRRDHGGDPAVTLLTDRGLIIDVVLWIIYCAWIVYRPI